MILFKDFSGFNREAASRALSPFGAGRTKPVSFRRIFVTSLARTQRSASAWGPQLGATRDSGFFRPNGRRTSVAFALHALAQQLAIAAHRLGLFPRPPLRGL